MRLGALGLRGWTGGAAVASATTAWLRLLRLVAAKFRCDTHRQPSSAATVGAAATVDAAAGALLQSCDAAAGTVARGRLRRRTRPLREASLALWGNDRTHHPAGGFSALPPRGWCRDSLW